MDVLRSASGGLGERAARKLRGAAHGSAYALRQVRHRPSLPALGEPSRSIAREIDENGVAVRALEQLGFSSDERLASILDPVADALDDVTRDEMEYEDGFEHCVPLNPSEIAARFPDLFLWGLDESLLDLVEAIVGLPIAYHGVIARKDLVDGKGVGTRLWHRDQDDVDVIRVTVYLNDVLDDDGGPFQYVPRHLTPSYRAFRGVEAIDDAVMSRVVPEGRWERCLGPKGTVIFGAVSRVLHAGRMPKRPRKAASFYYTSTDPTREELCRKFSFEKGLSSLRLTGPLTERQRSCLWKYAAYLPPEAG